MRKSIMVLLALILTLLPLQAAGAEPELTPFELSSPSAILVDAGTGQVLSEQNADQQQHPAGAAKTMSILVVFEAIAEGRLSYDQTVQVSEKAASAGGTQAFLDAGQAYELERLLEGMCIASANDATIALAEASYGSEEAFVEQMNKRAQELGCENTVFENSTGLHSEGTKTTARDLAKIAAEVSNHKKAFAYTSVFISKLIHPDGRETELNNPNRMVRFFEGADGLSTGSSPESKYCGVLTAKRGDMRLIAVVLGANDSSARFADAQQMMEYGFANYNSRVLVKEGEILRKNVPVEKGSPKEIDVQAKQELRVLLRRGDEKQVRKELELSETIQPPVQQGAEVGKLNVYLGDELLASMPAVAAAGVNELSIREALIVIIRYWVRG